MESTFSRNDQRAIVAEFLGTFFFVFVGTGAVMAVGGAQNTGALVCIALAHGIGILVAVAMTANLSGGHINPAVTIAMMVTKNIKAPLAAAYIVAQLAAAALGSLLLKLCMPDVLEGQAPFLGAHNIAEGMASSEGLLMEIILTAFLVTVIFTTAVSRKGWGINAPIAIGLAITAIHFVAVPFTGASVNPARSFGPALVANEWDNFWVYIIGPAAGGLLVAAFWLFFKDLGDESLEPAPVVETPADA